DHGGAEAGAVETFAVVGDRGGDGRHFGGALGVAGVHPAPAIDEDLAADLLGDGGAVLGDGARTGRLDAGAQVEVSGVLGRAAIAAPPIHAVAFRGVVEPGFGHFLRGGAKLVVAHGPDEIDRAVGIVV